MAHFRSPTRGLGVVAEDTGAELSVQYALDVVRLFEFVADFGRGFSEVNLTGIGKGVTGGKVRMLPGVEKD